ncbi:MAG: NUDIX hydrolase [Gammaproteobacteria bacterium]|nr:NUDIX hydrolase [Gammaproteobacteria bacterium]
MTTIREWLRLRSEPVADCRVFTVERAYARSPIDGSEHDFYRILSVDWAQIVPVTPSGDIVMIRQYRHGAEKVTLEVPGGLVDPGEAPEEAAARECLEETGYRATGLRSLGALNPNPALFGHRLHTFVAEGVERVGEIQNSGREHTDVELVPARELPRLLSEGVIDHALIAVTLWRYVYESSCRG